MPNNNQPTNKKKKGVRAQQIAAGAPINVQVTAEMKGDPLNIAEAELRVIDMIWLGGSCLIVTTPPFCRRGKLI